MKSNIIASSILLGACFLSLYRYFRFEEIFFLLLAFRELIASINFLRRKNPIAESKNAFIAYLSSGLPYLYFPPSSLSFELISNVLFISGFFIVTLATIDLGKSIGVKAAKRDRVTTGIYKYINHPMYLGYSIAQFGMVLLNPINIFIYILSLFLFFKRSSEENRILNS